MTGASLEAFRVRMKWSKSELSAALGCDRKTLNRQLDGRSPIPRYIALACSSLAHGLPPME
jgi:plasmid maintenance system antidote protein VapI